MGYQSPNDAIPRKKKSFALLEVASAVRHLGYKWDAVSRVDVGKPCTRRNSRLHVSDNDAAEALFHVGSSWWPNTYVVSAYLQAARRHALSAGNVRRPSLHNGGTARTSVWHSKWAEYRFSKCNSWSPPIYRNAMKPCNRCDISDAFMFVLCVGLRQGCPLSQCRHRSGRYWLQAQRSRQAQPAASIPLSQGSPSAIEPHQHRMATDVAVPALHCQQYGCFLPFMI